MGYRHAWTPTLRSNFVYGRVSADLPHPAIVATTVSASTAVYLNLILAPFPNAMLGVELQRTQLKNDLGQKGSNNRLLTSFQYGF